MEKPLQHESDDQGFAKRLELLMDEAGWERRGRQTRMAKLAGVTQNSARKWVLGPIIPRQDKILLIADHFGCSPQWLRFGEIEQLSNGVTTSEVTGDEYSKVVVAPKPGADDEEQTDLREFHYRTSDLEEMGLVASKCVVIFAQGDAMAPNIKHGARLLVSKAHTNLFDDEVYAFEAAGAWKIRRVFINTDKSVTLSCDNDSARYPAEIVPNKALDRLKVIGQVFEQTGKP